MFWHRKRSEPKPYLHDENSAVIWVSLFIGVKDETELRKAETGQTFKLVPGDVLPVTRYTKKEVEICDGYPIPRSKIGKYRNTRNPFYYIRDW